jgi:hypothetical protein
MKRTRSNGKLEVFAQELAKGKSAPEAARAAGYEGTSLVSNATKRAANPRVRERVAAIQAKLAEQCAITSGILIDRAEECDCRPGGWSPAGDRLLSCSPKTRRV